MTITTRRRRRALALATVALLAAGLSACGDDDEDDAAGGDVAAGDLTTYCEKTFEIETIGEPDIDFESASEEEMQEAAKSFAGDDLLPLAREIEEAAPQEIAADIEVLVAAVEDVAETGNFEAFETEEAAAAGTRAHEFDLENCDWNVAEVTAVDYAFEGVQASYPAGPTSFEFANDGDELHELIVMRKKDDTGESFDELLELPEEEAQAKVDMVGSVFAEPGEEGVYSVMDLEAGEYLGICFIPTGLTPEAAEAAESGGEEPQGPPHFTQGMKEEFTVN